MASDEAMFRSAGDPIAYAVVRLKKSRSDGDVAALLSSPAGSQVGSEPLARVTVTPIRTVLVGPFGAALAAVGGCVLAIYLLACMNVVNGVLARQIERRSADAIRCALGARRIHFVSYAVGEGVVLSAIALVGGVSCAIAGSGILRSATATVLPKVEGAWASSGQDVVVTVLAVLLPWLISSAVGAHVQLLTTTDSLHGLYLRSRFRSRRIGLSAASLVFQATFATVLLSATILLLSSVVALAKVSWGFEPGGLAVLGVRVPENYREKATLREYAEGIQAAVVRLPGVHSATVTENMPIAWTSWAPVPLATDRFATNGWRAALWRVGPGHFRALGTRLLAGREFDNRDSSAAPCVAVISHALAARLWPGQDALGRAVRVLEYRNDGRNLAPEIAVRIAKHDRSLDNDPAAFQDAEPLPRQVVGVVENIRMFGLDAAPDAALYVCTFQPVPRFGPAPDQLFLALRADGEAVALQGARRAILALHPESEFREATTGRDLMARSLGGRAATRAVAVVVLLLTCCAIGLQTHGLYATLSYAVRRQARDFSIRSALGLTPMAAARQVLYRSLLWTGVGVLAGTPLAILTNAGLRPFLFDASPWNLWAYLAESALLLIAAIASLPAVIYVARIGPSLAARHE